MTSSGGKSFRAGSLLEELPSEYLQRMQRLLGEEFPRFQEIYAQPSISGLRLNTLKITVSEFLPCSPFKLEPISWAAEGFILLPTQPSSQPGKHPFHAAGLYYLQDPSAMAVVELLDPQPGEKVLDLSAAPGGKSTHILSRMHDQGLLVANEMHPRRAWDLAQNLERWGAHHTTILNEQPQRLADHFGAFFDRVLVDAPCSGEGMFRKSQSAISAWSPSLVYSCALRQLNILEQAACLVRPGGILVYSTCTFAPEEDETVVWQFLEKHSRHKSATYEVIQTKQMNGFYPGKPEWVESQPGQNLSTSLLPQLQRTVRLWPHRGAPEGHFVAVLKRTDAGPESALKPHRTRLPSAPMQAFRQFCLENLDKACLPQFEPELEQRGSYLYAHPAMLPDLGKLRSIHPGWWLGQLKANRFEPSHALALGLRSDQALYQVCLQVDDPTLAAYLRGESLPFEGENSWVLVSVTGTGLYKAFPIGWGKRSGGILKNFYPHGLRWS